MINKLVYITTRFPIFSTTFVCNEINNLKKYGCNIEAVLALIHTHDPIDTGLESITFYPPPFLVILCNFIIVCLLKPFTIARLIAYLFKIHKKELITMKAGKTSFLKGIAILPLLLWYHKKLGNESYHFHAHFTVMATTAAMVLSHLRKTPFSITGHGSDIFLYPPKNLDLRIQAARFFITVSKYNKDYILKNFSTVNGNKIHVIPAGIKTDDFKKIRKCNKADKIEKAHFITVARLSPEKGIEVFIRALSQFASLTMNFHYTIIGDGQQRNFLENLTHNLGLGDKIHFLGFRNQDFIIRSLQNSHLFILTSYSEGFPVVLMEAASAGLPILATNITAIPEIVHHNKNGLLVEAGNVDEILQSLKALWADNWALLRRLYDNAQKQDVSKFDCSNTIPKIKALLYQQL